jgi:hypothetical protein
MLSTFSASEVTPGLGPGGIPESKVGQLGVKDLLVQYKMRPYRFFEIILGE